MKREPLRLLPPAGRFRLLARQGGRGLLGEPLKLASDQRLSVRRNRQGVRAVIDKNVALRERDCQRLIDATLDKGVDERLLDLHQRGIYRDG